MRSKYRLLLLIGILFLLANFYYWVWYNAYNLPRSGDDIYFFFKQFINDFLECESLTCKLSYFFQVSTWPHPKFGGRILQTLQYYTLSEVNFKSIILLGNIALLLPCIFMAKRLKPKFEINFLILASFVFVPFLNNFWPIFIVNYAFIIGFALLLFHYTLEKNYLLFFFLSIMMVFSHGNGVTAPLIAIVLYIFQAYQAKEIDRKYLLFCTSIFVISAALFYHFILHSHLAKDSVSVASEQGIFMKIINLCVYLPTFITANILEPIFERNFNIWRYLCALTLFIPAVLIMIKTLFTKRKDLFVILGLAVFMLGSGFLAGLVRGDSATSFPSVAPRYEYWSSFFWACIVLLAYQLFGKIKYIIPVLISFCFIIYLIRFSDNQNFLKGDKKYRSSIVANMLGDDYFNSDWDKIKATQLRAKVDQGYWTIPKMFYDSPQEPLKKHVNTKLEPSKIRIVKSQNNPYQRRYLIGIRRSFVKNKSFYFSEKKKRRLHSIYPAREISKKLAFRERPNAIAHNEKLQKFDFYEIIAPPGKTDLQLSYFEDDIFYLVENSLSK